MLNTFTTILYYISTYMLNIYKCIDFYVFMRLMMCCTKFPTWINKVLLLLLLLLLQNKLVSKFRTECSKYQVLSRHIKGFTYPGSGSDLRFLAATCVTAFVKLHWIVCVGPCYILFVVTGSSLRSFHSRNINIHT